MSTATELVLRHCGREYRALAAATEEARLTLTANIRYAVAEGMSELAVANLTGTSRTTVRKALGK